MRSRLMRNTSGAEDTLRAMLIDLHAEGRHLDAALVQHCRDVVAGVSERTHQDQSAQACEVGS